MPPSILEHWYICGRKVPYATETIAHLVGTRKPSYPCPFGNHWHVGRTSTRAPGRFNRPRRLNAAKAWDRQEWAL